MLKCSTDVESNWNGFVSDFTNWNLQKNGTAYEMCDEGTEDFFDDPDSLPPVAMFEFRPFWDAGAKTIWANGIQEYKVVTFEGSPMNDN